MSRLPPKGVIHLLRDRVVFTERPIDGDYTWEFPLRSLRAVREIDGDVVLERVGLPGRFRPMNATLDEVIASIRKHVADRSSMSSASRQPSFRNVYAKPSRTVLLSVDNFRIWTLEQQRPTVEHDGISYTPAPTGTVVGPNFISKVRLPHPYVRPATTIATGIQWVASDVEVAPGRHRVTTGRSFGDAGGGGVMYTLCVADVEIQSNRTYLLTQPKRAVLELRDLDSGREVRIPCDPDPFPEWKVAATLTPDAGVVMTDVDRWSPWITVGDTRYVRNPYPATSGVKWNGSQVALLPGKHVVSVGYEESDQFIQVGSMANCALEFDAIAGERYTIRSEGLGRGRLGPLGIPKAWRAWIEDRAGKIVVGTCRWE
jgi:hypothetical protein